MLNDNVFYWGIVRKVIVAFGNLFSNIYIDRKENGSVDGTTIQRLQIPISYSAKEKWIVRIEQDPTLENHTYTTLPRIAFEIVGYNYDASRHINKMNRISCTTSETSSEIFAPVPYNIDIQLYVLTKTQEDALQIIEQILPTFTPEYTLSINAVPDMNIIQDIPITLNSISVSDEYDGDFQTRRFVTHTLSFTIKTNLFGGLTQNKRIYHTEAGISTSPTMTPRIAVHTADGDPETGEVTDSWIEEL